MKFRFGTITFEIIKCLQQKMYYSVINSCFVNKIEYNKKISHMNWQTDQIGVW